MWRGDIEGYALEDVLGSGGMGTVYRATQRSLGRPVAIKVLGEAHLDDAGLVERFQREGSLQASLQHPHIVPVFERGEVDGRPFIVMRFVDGPSLRELVRAGALHPETAVELLAGVAAALDFAHAHGVLHRDVKPHNVLVEGGRHAWLADFGLTRRLADASELTGVNGLVGTFDYLAPEVARGEPATAASDVYALAATTFQALTGSLPFPAAHEAAAVLAHALSERPRASDVNPALPRTVDAPLRRGMALAPEDRQLSAAALIGDVREALGLSRGEVVGAPVGTERVGLARAGASGGGEALSAAVTRPPAGGDGRRRVASRRAASAAAVAILVAAAGGLVIGLNLHRTPGAAQLLPLASNAALRSYPLETVGGPAHTWSNYLDAGGREGPPIADHQSVRIACSVWGFEVPDHDHWWYRIASPPWDGRYYVTADAFYNNGRVSGTLIGTLLVDPMVKPCA